MAPTRRFGLFWNVVITNVPRLPAPMTPSEIVSDAACATAPLAATSKDRLFMQITPLRPNLHRVSERAGGGQSWPQRPSQAARPAGMRVGGQDCPSHPS